LFIAQILSAATWHGSSNLDTFLLKIKQFWPFEEIYIFSNGGHLGFPIGIKNIKLVEDLPMIIPGQFGFNCRSSTKCVFFMPIENSRWPPPQDID
jgi:hypothetical protein